jgi:hypothetical protein
LIESHFILYFIEFYALKIIAHTTATLIAVRSARGEGAASSHRRGCEAKDARGEDRANPHL